MTRIEFILAWRRACHDRCFYCGSTFGAEGTLLAVSQEHVYPKYKYPQLRYNTVKACRGCNFAKNGFEPDAFREWWGEEFYCEWLLKEKLPPIRDALLNDLYRMVNKHFNEEVRRLKCEQPWGGRKMTMKFRKIIREARPKSVRKNRTSQGDPKN